MQTGKCFLFIIPLTSILVSIICYFWVFPRLPQLLRHRDVLIAVFNIVFLSSQFMDILQNTLMFAGHGYFIFGLLQMSSPCSMHPENALLVKGFEFQYDEDHGYYYYIRNYESATIVFMHGNGKPACCWLYKDIMKLFLSIDVNIVVIEYRGYGRRCNKCAHFARLEDIRTDLVAQWTHVSSLVDPSGLILTGVSLGGGFAWSAIDRLSPPPVQLILINTFADLGLFVNHFVAYAISPFVAPLIPCFVSPSILKYRLENFQKDWNGKVLCVHTADDNLFPSYHLKIFREHFSSYGSTSANDFEEFICLKGGHNEGYICYDGWLSRLAISKISFKS